MSKLIDHQLAELWQTCRLLGMDDAGMLQAMNDWHIKQVNEKLQLIDRALPAKTSIVETQSKEAAAPALKVIDVVRKTIKEVSL